MKTEIEDYFKGKVLVDVSREAIQDLVFLNQKYFDFNEVKSTILFDVSKRKELIEDVYFIYNSKVDQTIRQELINFLQEWN